MEVAIPGWGEFSYRTRHEKWHTLCRENKGKLEVVTPLIGEDLMDPVVGRQLCVAAYHRGDAEFFSRVILDRANPAILNIAIRYLCQLKNSDEEILSLCQELSLKTRLGIKIMNRLKGEKKYELMRRILNQAVDISYPALPQMGDGPTTGYEAAIMNRNLSLTVRYGSIEDVEKIVSNVHTPARALARAFKRFPGLVKVWLRQQLEIDPIFSKGNDESDVAAGVAPLPKKVQEMSRWCVRYGSEAVREQEHLNCTVELYFRIREAMGEGHCPKLPRRIIRKHSAAVADRVAMMRQATSGLQMHQWRQILNSKVTVEKKKSLVEKFLPEVDRIHFKKELLNMHIYNLALAKGTYPAVRILRMKIPLELKEKTAREALQNNEPDIYTKEWFTLVEHLPWDEAYVYLAKAHQHPDKENRMQAHSTLSNMIKNRYPERLWSLVYWNKHSQREQDPVRIHTLRVMRHHKPEQLVLQDKAILESAFTSAWKAIDYSWATREELQKLGFQLYIGGWVEGWEWALKSCDDNRHLAIDFDTLMAVCKREGGEQLVLEVLKQFVAGSKLSRHNLMDGQGALPRLIKEHPEVIPNIIDYVIENLASFNRYVPRIYETLLRYPKFKARWFDWLRRNVPLLIGNPTFLATIISSYPDFTTELVCWMREEVDRQEERDKKEAEAKQQQAAAAAKPAQQVMEEIHEETGREKKTDEGDEAMGDGSESDKEESQEDGEDAEESPAEEDNSEGEEKPAQGAQPEPTRHTNPWDHRRYTWGPLPLTAGQHNISRWPPAARRDYVGQLVKGWNNHFGTLDDENVKRNNWQQRRIVEDLIYLMLLLRELGAFDELQNLVEGVGTHRIQQLVQFGISCLARMKKFTLSEWRDAVKSITFRDDEVPEGWTMLSDPKRPQDPCGDGCTSSVSVMGVTTPSRMRGIGITKGGRSSSTSSADEGKKEQPGVDLVLATLSRIPIIWKRRTLAEKKLEFVTLWEEYVKPSTPAIYLATVVGLLSCLDPESRREYVPKVLERKTELVPALFPIRNMSPEATTAFLELVKRMPSPRVLRRTYELNLKALSPRQLLETIDQVREVEDPILQKIMEKYFPNFTGQPASYALRMLVDALQQCDTTEEVARYAFAWAKRDDGKTVVDTLHGNQRWVNDARITDLVLSFLDDYDYPYPTAEQALQGEFPAVPEPTVEPILPIGNSQDSVKIRGPIGSRKVGKAWNAMNFHPCIKDKVAFVKTMVTRRIWTKKMVASIGASLNKEEFLEFVKFLWENDADAGWQVYNQCCPAFNAEDRMWAIEQLWETGNAVLRCTAWVLFSGRAAPYWTPEYRALYDQFAGCRETDPIVASMAAMHPPQENNQEEESDSEDESSSEEED